MYERHVIGERLISMQDENHLEEPVGLGTMPPEFVPVTFSATREEAERVREVLESFNIPALSDDGGVEGCADAALGRGLPVLVPEHLHDRASDVIAELESATTSGDASLGVALDNVEEDEDYVEEGDEDADDDFDELDDDLDEDFEDEDFDDGDGDEDDGDGDEEDGSDELDVDDDCDPGRDDLDGLD